MEERTEIKKIPERFKAGGYSYVLVKRDGALAIYEHSGSGYEVHMIRKRTKSNTHVFPGGGMSVQVKGDEYLASEEEFGQFGWAFTNLENAEKKIENLKRTRPIESRGD
jgi:hypothetical protein